MADQQLARQMFKHFNKFMLFNWRLGMGPYLSFWPYGFGRYLVLIHTGRKTGLTRRTPVNYAPIDGDFYVTAGWGTKAHWYRNIMAGPHIEVWAPDGRWLAEAEDISDEEGSTAIMREVLKNSGFASFAAGINPHRIRDEDLAAATTDYRLLRLRPTEAASGPDGPGDLVWVWPVTVLVLLAGLLVGRRPRPAQRS
ncbi:MAG: nitroreductase family deazaflavin-dependent oxidoreductase [Chloroflexi bacterium]|nr:nitroreductase family deazaflavin-dependent oxidoreductase [Chloroflexota bacterium]